LEDLDESYILKLKYRHWNVVIYEKNYLIL
jgi:hypothetical protein